jgi:glycosyltransferase involved in cell wall biosynthesis
MKYDITVGIPTYNRSHCLGKAIDSVLAIKGVTVEVVVCDNCSSDETPFVMQRYRDNPRVKYFRNSFNIGPTGNYNQCLERAMGRYFMILGDDDWLSPNYGRILIETTRDEDVVFVGRCITVSPDGVETHKSCDSYFDVSGPDFIRDLIQLQPYTSRHAYFMFAARTTSLRDAGGFPSTEAGQHTDNMLLMRLLLNRTIRNNPNAVNYYSVYPGSYGNSNVKSVSIATLQLLDYWDDYIHPELAKLIPKRDVMRLRKDLARNATLTYIRRVLEYGADLRQKLNLLLLFPRKTWLIKAAIRKQTVVSIMSRVGNALINR